MVSQSDATFPQGKLLSCFSVGNACSTLTHFCGGMETLYFITKYLSYDTRAFSKIREFQRESFYDNDTFQFLQFLCSRIFQVSNVEGTKPIATAGASLARLVPS